MSRRKKSVRHPRPSDGVSYERCSGEQALALFFIRNPGIWHTLEDSEKYLESIGKPLRKGTIYNYLWAMRRKQLIEADGGNPVRHRLLQNGSENYPTGVRGRRGEQSLRPLIIKLGFLEYLKTLSFEDVKMIHNIRLWTPVTEVDFVNKGWKYKKTQRVFWRREIVDGRYGFNIRAYEKVRTLDISVACANRPVAVGEEGLNNLYDALWVVRTKFLNLPSVPYPSRWTITQWHCGKDAKRTIAGLSFEVTWRDFYGNLIRVYTRDKADGKVRVERVESPDDFVERLLGPPEESIKKMMTGEPTTCVADDLRTIRADFAWKMSGESFVSDALGTDALLLTQSLHV